MAPTWASDGYGVERYLDWILISPVDAYYGLMELSLCLRGIEAYPSGAPLLDTVQELAQLAEAAMVSRRRVMG